MKRLFVFQSPVPMEQVELEKVIASMKKFLAAGNIDAEVIGLCGGEQLIEIPTDDSPIEVE